MFQGVTKWDNIWDIFMARWASVCAGPIRKDFEKMLPIVRYCPLSMSAVILIAVDILSNTTESEKTNKLFDDPERDVQLKKFNAINEPQRWSHGKLV